MTSFSSRTSLGVWWSALSAFAGEHKFSFDHHNLEDPVNKPRFTKQVSCLSVSLCRYQFQCMTIVMTIMSDCRNTWWKERESPPPGHQEDEGTDSFRFVSFGGQDTCINLRWQRNFLLNSLPCNLTICKQSLSGKEN